MTVAHYRVFGLTLASPFPFTFSLLPGDPPADLVFDIAPVLAGGPPGDFGRLVYESPVTDEAGRPVLRIRQAGADDHLLHFPGIGVFAVGPGQIAADLLEPRRHDLLEIRFLGTVLSFFLERRGVICLHASAVRVGDGAIAFLGGNRSGKTGLAATFLQSGHGLLSDDILPVELSGTSATASPGYPQMRVWPDLAIHLAGAAEGLPRVVPELEKRRLVVGDEGLGQICRDPLPAFAIYVPERKEESRGGVEIQPLSPRDAVMELLRSSFLARPAEALGWQSRRLETLFELVRRVPFRRLIYPAGFEHLERVREAVLEDLREGPAPAGPPRSRRGSGRARE